MRKSVFDIISAQAPAVETAAPVGSEVTTAALDNDVADMCPVCRRKMQLASAAGIPVYACLEHRVANPVPE